VETVYNRIADILVVEVYYLPWPVNKRVALVTSKRKLAAAYEYNSLDYILTGMW